MFLLVFPLWVCRLLVFGATCMFGCPPPPLVVCLDATMFVRKHLHDVWFACRLSSSLLLALHVRVSHVNPSVCLITCLPFPLVW